MLADLVVFSEDPLADDPGALLALKVGATIVDGSVAYVASGHEDLVV